MMNDATSQKGEKSVLREWQESAPYWAKHADIVRAMFAPITQALIEAGSISKGQVVLDVAGGAGEPSISISSTVGASGRVFFTDAIAEMVTTARSEARRHARTNIEFSQCVAESLPFPNDALDAVVCRLGVMLFPDPLAAIREALRVVKPGGSLTYAVWATRDSNPFFHVVMDIVSRYVESPPEDPEAPGAFRFAEPGKLAHLVKEAGATEVTERLLEFTLEAPITPRQFWEVRSELSDTLRAKLAQLSSDQVARVGREAERAGQDYFADGNMKFPAQVVIVTGRK